MNNRNSAFTLAEVLITLAIIGVIAAISVPSLIQKTNSAELRTAYKKQYAQLSQAIDQILFERGGSLANVYKNNADLFTDLKTHLKVIKECTDGNAFTGGCSSSDNLLYLDNTPMTPSWFSAQTVSALVLNSGAILYSAFRDTSCNYTGAMDVNTPVCATITIDVNGLKGPNVTGKDQFWVGLQSDRIAPAGQNDSTIQCPSGIGADCASKYLYSDK